MPPKKQVKREKSKFRRGATGVKKGKRKTSQKQIVNVSVTSSGSGGSGMGVPSQPMFLPSHYQQPLFTPTIDPIKNTLTEVLKDPAAIDSIKKTLTEALQEPGVDSWKMGKETTASKKLSFESETPPSTKTFNSPRTQFRDNWGFDDVYGSNPMHDSGYHSATESTPRRQPRDAPPTITADGKPFWAGIGRKSNSYKVWEANTNHKKNLLWILIIYLKKK